MCAIFGLIDYDNVLSPRKRAMLLRRLSVASEVRGTDATGFAYTSHNHLTIFKRPLPAHKTHLFLPNDARVAIGHTRQATQGPSKLNWNNHPFSGNASVAFALAHNGIIHNDAQLRKQFKLPDSKVTTDSYIATQLIEKYGEVSPESLQYVAELLEGSFVLTILCADNSVYLVRGNNPIVLFEFNGFYVYASTLSILQDSLTYLHMKDLPHKQIQIIEGDIVRIDPFGGLSRSCFNYLDTLQSSFYNTYFATYFDSDGIYDPYGEDSLETLTTLYQLAADIGYDSQAVDALLSCGYSPYDIIDYTLDADAFQAALQSIVDYTL